MSIHQHEISKEQQSCVTYYDSNSKEYFNEYIDELIKKPYDKAFLEMFMSHIQCKAKILDIGCCSTAQQARYFYENGFAVTAIDLSEECIKLAKQNFTGIKFEQKNMLELNYNSDTFDAINAFYSIIHIQNEDLDTLFLGFKRVLKSQGIIAIAVHAGNFYGFYNAHEIPVFYRTYTQTELTQILLKHGFSILHIHQREPIYKFEFQSERIYIIAKLRE